MKYVRWLVWLQEFPRASATRENKKKSMRPWKSCVRINRCISTSYLAMEFRSYSYFFIRPLDAFCQAAGRSRWDIREEMYKCTFLYGASTILHLCFWIIINLLCIPYNQYRLVVATSQDRSMTTVEDSSMEIADISNGPMSQEQKGYAKGNSG